MAEGGRGRRAAGDLEAAISGTLFKGNSRHYSGEGDSVRKGRWHPDGAVEGKEMTAAELREIVVSSEFKQGLEELSSYLHAIHGHRVRL
jgi:hypothetical protein